MTFQDIMFSLRPIPPEISSKGGFYGVLSNRPTYTFDNIIAEARVRRGLSGDTKLLRSNMEMVFDTAVELTIKMGANCRFDGYFLFRPVLKGWFKNKDSAFDPARQTVVLNATCLKDMKIDTSGWTLHNVTQGAMPKISGICTLGHAEDETVTRGLDFQIVGERLTLLEGDTVMYVCQPAAGEAVEGEFAVRPAMCSGAVITCAWPAELDASMVGAKLTVIVRNRCGNPDAGPQKAERTVTIVAGEEPGPTPVGPEVTAINDGTFHAGAGNVVTGANMRFADAFPGNHILIKDAQGTDMEAMISTDAEIPVTETRFALNLDEGQPLTDGEEYTFEFEMVDADNRPVTVTSKARWQAS